ncbi:UDP-N-acetylmuramoyl-tripeptide--D-alanyl-D-alanine ligase [Silicimonas algicola]|uniref:UDP-N-acetylmuramoyl-tripeptide--D-alanyl-D-alanine ligase n=2 Tax=Silicimonas algicola TaxID=1826607 RepID=A0A316GUG4_9RHOB|nr:UDP-N-acetylmuramoyl-tripeptide--D-alanyl-D-alanine ligase [Silicimonas algicola]
MTVPLWTSAAARAVMGAEALGPAWTATGVSIDTRTLKPGDLFVALTDVRDGHDFVADALNRGAAAALVSRVPEGLDRDACLLVVPDVLAALERLGAAARERTAAKVVAITGSAGKTSTKEMLRHVLSAQGRTHAAEASYNNHWGVPLTLARMPAETDFAVIEIGMNHPGEIEPLARLARPDVAIVTTVAAAHLEAFDSVEAIAEEKAAIFRGLEPGGTALFNADVETAPILNAGAKLHAARRIGFGEHADAALRADSVTLCATASVVEGHFGGRSFILKVGAPGRHFAMNALAVYGAALVLDVDTDIAACDIGLWRAPAGRGQRETLVLDQVEDLTADLIDDAFNANPASMTAAFEVLAQMPTGATQDGRGRGRRIAILGDMLELGVEELALHADLAAHPAMERIDRVECVGPRMRALYEALPAHKRGRWVDTAPELAQIAHRLIGAGDVVLVKGSKGSKVSLVVDALRKLSRVTDREEEKGLA